MNTCSIDELFRDLAAKDIHIRLVDGRLRVNAPKEGLPADLREQLSARKQEILDFLEAANSGASHVIPELVASDDRTPAPLSFGQQRIWVLHELSREYASPYDTLAFNLRLQGKLNIPALNHSLSRILERHEILRTVVDFHREHPVQKILPSIEIKLEAQDLQIDMDGNLDEAVRSVLADAKETLLDPAIGPLFQARLARLAAHDHVLIFIVHHLVFDAWSLAILTRELIALYEGFMRGDMNPLPEPSLQYGDFARWQREWLQGQELERHLSYWRDKLEGATTLDLPLDDLRPAIQTFNGDTQSVFIARETADQLLKLGQKNDASLFMTMLSSLGLFLSRYCGQSDIAIGTPVTSRDRKELQQLIGFFLNTLVMRLDYSGDVDFLSLLGRCRQTCLEAFAHQHLPFEKLVEEMHLERDQSITPLFQVMFWLKGTPDSSPITVPDLEVSALPQPGNTTRFDLDVSVVEGVEGFGVFFTYNTDLFRPQTIRRMLEQYRTLLESIVAEPNRPAYSLALINDAERTSILQSHNQTQRDYDLEITLSGLFERQVDETPDAVALIFEHQSLTYLELDQMSNQLAHYLHEHGISVGDTVGVFMERSLEMVIALYAIHKAGAAYVPLDTDYPASRLGWMIEDTGARLILSQSDLVERLPAHEAAVLFLNGDHWQTRLDRFAQTRLSLSAGPDDPAYVIYTSGSTGKPKGVVNAHRGVVNLLLAMQEAYGLGATDCDLQKTPYSFDVSVLELFWPLANGARLVIARPDGHKDPAYISAIVKDRAVTTLHFVPSMLRAFLESGSIGTAVSLKRVICIGEALPYELQQQFYGQSKAQLLNLYGPTEAAVVVSAWLCRADDERKLVPIGYPLANTSLYILDARAQPVPRGVAGELHIGGVQVAQGYLNRPELTAEKFIADPYSERAGARLYKTGDRARYLEDGSIEYLGRIDNQVKLRGHRIELGEIEALLLDCEGITAAVAAVREDIPQNPLLVAYVSCDEGSLFNEDRIKGFLAGHIPQYMLPSRVVLLSKLPLSVSGKVDRHRLPPPPQDDQENPRAMESPRTETEQKIAIILQELLVLDALDVHDNFFRLGGHSLLAIRAVNRINEAFPSSLSFSRFMTLATVAKIATHIEAEHHTEDTAASGEKPLKALIDVSVDGGVYPLSPAQERLWYIYTLYPDVSAYNVQMQVNVSSGIETVTRALELIQQRHAVLRTTYRLEGSQPAQVIHNYLPLSITHLDITNSTQSEISEKLLAQVHQDAKRVFDLDTGPVWRCSIIEHGEHQMNLFVTIHHIATDGWSMNLLRQELQQLCRDGDLAVDQAVLKPVIQYVDYSLWQSGRFEQGQLEKLQAYWKQTLAGAPPSIALPTDKPRPPVYSYSGAIEYVALGTAQSRNLRQFSRDREVTLFMLMFSVFNLLLARYTQQSDIVVGTPVSGRTGSEMDGIVGIFVNSLVLRTQLSGIRTFDELLSSVRTTILSAFEHQDLAFEKIVEMLQPDRDLSRNPLFQVMFSFLVPETESEAAMVGEAVELSGEIESGVAAGAQVDLSLVVKDDHDQLLIALVYNTDLFEAATIRQMLDHYRRLLESSIASSAMPLDQLEMLSATERASILQSHNQTQRDYDLEVTLSGLFERQVDETPDAVALIFEHQSLTYLELDQMSNQLAHYLHEHGISVGDTVGVFMERSLEMVIALYAIHKAGAAYVPLDTDYPASRLGWMIEDTGARLILSQSDLVERLPAHEAAVLFLNGDHWQTRLDRFAQTRLSQSAGPDDPAYVIYTSGSTGKPKGVVNAHRGVVNLLLAMQEAYGLGSADCDLQKTPYSFDVSVLELFWPLANGARLVIARPDGHKDPAYISAIVKDRAVTTLHFVPSMLRAFLESGSIGTAVSLKRVICIGEALPYELQQQFYGQSKAQLLNLYGPTEAAVVVSAWLCRADDERKLVPIGYPLANTCLYILDARGQPVPRGVGGELHIGGVQVAQGYLNRPELTAEKFIADPYSERAGARLYKTGDRARYLEDGSIEYLGRIDNQVKLRGHRIELGEIEAALLDLDTVHSAAVILREGEPDDQRIVAYLILKQETEIDASTVMSDIHDYLRQHLPIYMVPAHIETVERFPLLPNGKLNVRELPRPSRVQKPAGLIVNKPETEMERVMARIWEELLDIDGIETDEMFFDLGGHSLLTLKVVDRFARETGVRIAPASLISQTLRQLAATAESSGAVSEQPAADKDHKKLTLRG